MANPPAGYSLQPRADGYYTPKGAGPATWDGTTMSPTLTDVAPPAGYSIQQGAYYTDDGQGPYVWDGASMVLLGAESSGLCVQAYSFSGAGTYIVANGPVVAYSINLTTAATGDVRIYDGTAASGVDVLGVTATTAGVTGVIRVGAPPTYGLANNGLCLVVTGASSGVILFGER